MDEFALIRRYFASGAAAVCRRADIGGDAGAQAAAAWRYPALSLGIGDDAALLRPPAGCELAVCCDTLVAGRHFDERATPQDIGWKALAVNLSDLAAMGGEPLAFLLALTLPEAEASWLEAFSEGLHACAGEYDLPLAGGDTTRGPLTVTVSLLGSVPAGSALRRDRARAGHRVAVTGTLGAAAAALAGQGDAAAVRCLHRPQPRLAAGVALRGYAHAAIDISDGLLADLHHLAEASGVGMDLHSDLLPAAGAVRACADSRQRLQWLTAGGDDYELAVCLPAEAVSDAVAACAAVQTPLTVIGEVVAGEAVRLLDAHDGLLAGPEGGFRHFGAGE